MFSNTRFTWKVLKFVIDISIYKRLWQKQVDFLSEQIQEFVQFGCSSKLSVINK